MTTVTIPAPVGEILKTLEAAGYGACLLYTSDAADD